MLNFLGALVLVFFTLKGSALSIGNIHSMCRVNRHLLKSTSSASLQNGPNVLNSYTTAKVLDWGGIDEEIWIQESNQEVMLPDSSVLLLAARVLNSKYDQGSTHDESETEHPSFECEGALLQMNPSLHSLEFTIQLATRIHEKNHILMDTITTTTAVLPVNLLDPQVAIFNILLHRYLNQEKQVWITRQERANLKLVLDDDTDRYISYVLESIGIRNDSSSFTQDFPIHLPKFVPYLHAYAFRHRGTSQGRTALLVLQQLSQRRVGFDVPTFLRSSNPPSTGATIISLEKNVLPLDVVSNVMNTMKNTIQVKKWLSTNPDSVDGIPSLHLNLISGGKDMFDENEMDDMDDADFAQCVTDLTRILKPTLYDKLLPRIQELTHSKTVEISDVFLRSYGKDGDSKGSMDKDVRYGLSSHYDITSYVTCVIALDDTAIFGSNGLYTIISDEGSISNHAALRKFFPLGKGDAVIHTYDVLHGVDIDPTLNQSRTSLIIWLVDYQHPMKSAGESNGFKMKDYPWLEHPRNDVEEFILGLATENDVMNEKDDAMTRDASIDTLFFQSARKGNSFALHALGQRMAAKDRIWDSTIHDDLVFQLKQNLNPKNPFLSKSLSQALWFESSMVGNSNAQVSLADDIMMNVFAMDDDISDELEQKKDMILMASTLFTMANVQGVDVTSSLERILSYYLHRYKKNEENVETEEDEVWEDDVLQMLLLSFD